MKRPQGGMTAQSQYVGVSRRGVLQGIGALIAGGWLGLVARSARPNDVTGTPAPPVHALGRNAFATYLGDAFHVEGGAAGPVEMQLVGVADRRPRGNGHHGGESFALVFRSPGDQVLGQDTYLFSHTDLGTFPLFIVPGLAGPDGVSHEAIINRLPAR